MLRDCDSGVIPTKARAAVGAARRVTVTSEPRSREPSGSFEK